MRQAAIGRFLWRWGLLKLLLAGGNTDVFNLDGIAGSQREYIHWLISSCTKSDIAVESILTEEAIDLLATRLRTPLQIQLHLTLSLEAGYQTSETPVSADLVESVLSLKWFNKTGHF